MDVKRLAGTVLALSILPLALAPLAGAMPMPGDGPPTAMDVSSNTGDATMSIPIPVPPGTGGFVPQLALRYTSSQGDGPFGAGWALEFGEIRRSIRFGIPTFDDNADRFELGGQLLVVNPAESNANQTRYHTDTETFVRIHHIHNFVQDYWELTRPDGVKLRYGQIDPHRIRKDGTTGPIFRWLLGQMEDPYGNLIAFTHLIQDGEAYPLRVDYTFRGSPPVAVGTLRTLDFIYEPRPDPSLTFMGGARRNIVLRLDRIEVKTGSAIFRKLQFTYAGEPGAGKTYRTPRSRLVSAQVFGVGGIAALPAQTFEYRDAGDDPALQGTGAYWSPRSISIPAEVQGNPLVGLPLGVRLAQVNLDGIPDLVLANGNTSTGVTRAVYLGTGTGWSTSADPAWTAALNAVSGTHAAVRVAAVSTADGPRPCANSGIPSPQVVTSIEGVIFEDGKSRPVVASADPNQVLEFDLEPTWVMVDLNGDGLDDLVQSTNIGESVIEFNCGSSTAIAPIYAAGVTRSDVWINTGSGWIRDTTLSATMPPLSMLVINGKVKRYSLDPRFADIDGDARIDILAMAALPQAGGTSRTYEARAYRNTTTGWISAAALNPPTNHRLLEGDNRTTPDAYRDLDRSVQFIDLNRDGLSDTIKTQIEMAVGGGCSEQSYLESNVWLNAGSGWCDGSGAGACASATAQYLPPTSFQQRDPNGCSTSVPAGVVFVDLNGDRLLDLIRADGTAINGHSQLQKAWLHKPSAAGVSIWQEDAQFKPTFFFTTLFFQGFVSLGILVADYDADSAVDAVLLGSTNVGGFNPSGFGSDHARAGMIRFSDRLARLQNGRGGTVEYDYESATRQQIPFYNDAVDAALPDAEGTVLWTSRPVVKSRRLSGLDVEPVTETFLYAQPRLHVLDRMSLGFGGFQRTIAGVSLSDRIFEQRRGTAGRVRIQAVTSLENGVCGERLRTTNTFQVLAGDDPTVGEGSTAAARVGRLVEAATQTSHGTNLFCGGSGETVGSAIVRSFEYDPKNGDPGPGYNFITRTTTSRRTGAVVETRGLRTPDQTRWIVGLVGRSLLTTSAGELAKTELVYTSEGRVAQAIAYDGPRGNLSTAIARTTSRAYDAFGNLRSVTDPASRTTEICYDGDSAFSSGVSCSSPTTEATHGVAIALRDPLQQVTTFKPDPTTGQISESLRVYSGDREKREFDAFGRLKRSLFQPSGESDIILSETDYFDLNADPAAPQVHVVSRLRIQAGGSSSLRTAKYFDGFGQEVRSVEEAPPVSGQPRYFGVSKKRNLATLQSTTTFPASCGGDPHCLGLSSGTQPFTRESTDALGRTIRLDTPTGVARVDYRSVIRTHPDQSGSQSLDAALAMDPRGYLTQRIFDGKELVWVEECGNAPIGNPATADLSGVACQSPASTFYRYEGSGELREVYDALATSITDPTKATLRFVYDSLGRPIQTFDINKSGMTATSYNSAGLVAQETNARGQASTFTYDALDRTSTIAYPIGGGVNQQYTLAYDNRSRELMQVEQTNSSPAGSVQSLQAFDYDPLGRQVRETVKYKQSSTLVLESDLDLIGRPTRVRYPDANTEIAYEYEGGYLKRVCELGSALNCTGSGAVPYVSNADYDSIGRETAVTGFVSTENPFPPSMSFTYNASTYRLDRLKVNNLFEGQGAETLDLNYGYDAIGNVTSIGDGSIYFEGDADVSFSTNYTYDARNRLASRTRVFQTKHFTYDAVGNLTGKQVSGPGQTNQTYDSVRRHRVVQAAGMSYSYDADGNVIGRGPQEIAFDPLNRLTCIGISGSPCDGFAYGVDGIRLAGGGQATPLRVFIGDLFEWEPTTGRATARIYALGRQIAYKEIETATLRTGVGFGGWPIERLLPLVIGGIAAAALGALLLLLIRAGLAEGLATRPAYGAIALGACVLLALPPYAWAGFSTPPGQGTYRRWVWEDPLGSAVHITDEAGLAVHQRAFEPFGEVAAERGERSSEPTDQTFATHDFEAQFGVYYMKARWYDPAAGRFLSTDPVVRDLRAPQAFNAYSYVENNPINRVDPTGLFFLDFEDLFRGLGGIGSTLGGFAAGVSAFNLALTSTQKGDIFDILGVKPRVVPAESGGDLLRRLFEASLIVQFARTVIDTFALPENGGAGAPSAAPSEIKDFPPPGSVRNDSERPVEVIAERADNSTGERTLLQPGETRRVEAVLTADPNRAIKIPGKALGPFSAGSSAIVRSNGALVVVGNVVRAGPIQRVLRVGFSILEPSVVSPDVFVPTPAN